MVCSIEKLCVPLQKMGLVTRHCDVMVSHSYNLHLFPIKKFYSYGTNILNQNDYYFGNNHEFC